jgi:hypothetical protein
LKKELPLKSAQPVEQLESRNAVGSGFPLEEFLCISSQNPHGSGFNRCTAAQSKSDAAHLLADGSNVFGERFLERVFVESKLGGFSLLELILIDDRKGENLRIGRSRYDEQHPHRAERKKCNNERIVYAPCLGAKSAPPKFTA